VTEDPRVLIVDRSEETHEVLQTVLGRRGVRTYGARRTGRGLALAEQLQPDVIVLDIEAGQTDPEAVCASFAAQSRQNATPLVVLGSVRRASVAAELGEFVRKPYDWGPLVRKIEELLAHPKVSQRRAA